METVWPPELTPNLTWPEEIDAGTRAAIEAILQRHGANFDFMGRDARYEIKKTLLQSGVVEHIEVFINEDCRPMVPSTEMSMQDIRRDHTLDCLLHLYRLRFVSFRDKSKYCGPDILSLFPAWELKLWDEYERQSVLERWEAAGGKLYGGRMMAVKTSPVWDRMDGLTPEGQFSLGLPPFLLGWQCSWTQLRWSEAFLWAVDPEGVPSLMKERTPERIEKAYRACEEAKARLQRSLERTQAAPSD